ncbi:MAG: PD-(D/E)XK nuclease family protein [Candidatus Desantisbacteria bacterium]
MPTYSHSRLSTYESCPFKYKLHYMDRIKRKIEGIEGFMGSRVHDALEKLYKDLMVTKLNSLEELLNYYDGIWEKNWHESIIIIRTEYSAQDYKQSGRECIKKYYHSYQPFDQDITLGLEKMVNFSLDKEGKFNITGFIDRLSQRSDGLYEIHDYKTSKNLPELKDLGADRQLSLYQMDIAKRWNDTEKIELVWHYLVFDKELRLSRTQAELEKIKKDTIALIKEIETSTAFLPKESTLCQWCEYPDICPTRKHRYKIETLPPQEYLIEDGVKLVNDFADLQERKKQINTEIETIKVALIAYAQREKISVINGSNKKAMVKIESKIKYPTQEEKEKLESLERIIKEADKWMEVSKLDTSLLGKIVEAKKWDDELIEKVKDYQKIEQDVVSIRLAKIKEMDE